jgi:hypothetical protein
MYKKVLTVFLTVILFLAAVFLGGATVFRVDDVALVATIVSKQAKLETGKLQEEILALYKEESIFSVDETALDKVLKEYPYLRLTGFEKAYPEAFKANVKMPPAGHYGDPETEIGRVCVQLASPDFKYMNGETLTLEGGMGLRP